MLNVLQIKTSRFELNQNLSSFIIKSLTENNIRPADLEGRVLCVTSKIVSLAEGRIVNKAGVDKKDLIHKEADTYLADGPFNVSLTIKHGIMIPSAGIDESNAAGDFYILYPQEPFVSAQKLWAELKAHYGLKNFGIILTDSHTQPLRRGVVGIALSYWGFHGVQNLMGEKDLYGRELKFTLVHVADALAVSAVLNMGEAADACPLALVQYSGLAFSDVINPSEGIISPHDDLYFSLYSAQYKDKN